MDIIDKIKNRFKDKPSTEGIDENLLWAAIEQDLNQPKKKRRILFFMLPLGLLFISALTTIIYFNTSSTQQTNTHNSNNQNTLSQTKNTPINNETLCDTDKNTHAIGSEKTSNPSTKSNNESIVKNTTNKLIAKAENILNETAISKKQNNKINQTKATKKNFEPKVSSNTPSILQSITSTISNSKNTLEVNKTNNQNFNPFNPIAILNSQNPTTQKEENHATPPTKKDNQPYKRLTKPSTFSSINKIKNKTLKNLLKTKKPSSRQHKIPVLGNKKSVFQIGLLAGVNFSKPYFSKQSNSDSEFVNQLKKSHKTGIGRSFSLYISWQAKKAPIVIGSGLTYSDIEHRFNITLQSDSAYTNVNNILVNGTAIRNVQHFNHYQTLTLPIEVGTHIGKNRFIIGLNAGIGFNLLTKVSGKSLNGFNNINEINFKEESSTNFNQFFISGHLSPTLSYRINKQFLIQAKPSIHYLHNGQSKFHNAKHYNLLYDFKAGIILEL